MGYPTSQETGANHTETDDPETGEAPDWGDIPERSVWVSSAVMEVGEFAKASFTPLLFEKSVAFASTPDLLTCSGEDPGLCEGESLLTFANVNSAGMGMFTEGESWEFGSWVKTYLPADVGGIVDQSFAMREGRFLQVGFGLPEGWVNDGSDPRKAPNPHRIVITTSADGRTFTYGDQYVIAEADNLTDPEIVVLPSGECILYVSVGPNTARAYSEDCVSFGELEMLAVKGGVPGAVWDPEREEIALVLSDGGLSLVISTDGGAGITFGDPTRIAEGASSGSLAYTPEGWRLAYQVP